MLEVEGKTFHKLVEKKDYRTELYHNFCDIYEKDKNIKYKNLLSSYVITKNKDKFFSDTQFFTEEDFVKHSVPENCK